ncbi:hypothetical protein, partial [Agrobacterium larrymoorei]|uniref:hypothetical protein n=1 Tax=Agrobacterium larrymoorei TaxID=160699 RepID=UPI001AEECBCC
NKQPAHHIVISLERGTSSPAAPPPSSVSGLIREHPEHSQHQHQQKLQKNRKCLIYKAIFEKSHFNPSDRTQVPPRAACPAPLKSTVKGARQTASF